MLSTYMILVYLALLFFSIYMSVKYGRIELGHIRKATVRLRSTITRLVLMYRIISLIMKKPFTAVIVIIILLSLLISSYSATSSTAVTEIPLSEDECVGCYPSTVLIELSEPSQVSCRTIGDDLLNVSNEVGAGCRTYLRLTLPEPLITNISKEPIYVLIGIESDFAQQELGVSLEEGFIYAGSTGEGPTLIEITLPNGTKVLSSIIYVEARKLMNASIVDAIPLLPIQAYLGSKPIVPPIKYVLVGLTDDVAGLVGLGRGWATDILLITYTGVTDAAEIFEVLSQEYAISKVWVIRPGIAYVASDTQVPTTSSVTVALVSSFMAVVLSTSLFTSVIPYIKDLYRKLSYEGFPPWAMTVVLSMYVSFTVWGVGLPSLAFSYIELGSVSAFNTLVTCVVVWVSLLVYVGLGTKPASLMTDVYTPPTARYVVVTKLTNLKEIVGLVREIIRTNEFFTVEEIESRVGGAEALVHARLSYNESWGSGVDMSIIVSREGDSTFISINTNVWGIEEISENVTRNMIALAISRIVGGVKSWEVKY